MSVTDSYTEVYLNKSISMVSTDCYFSIHSSADFQSCLTSCTMHSSNLLLLTTINYHACMHACTKAVLSITDDKMRAYLKMNPFEHTEKEICINQLTKPTVAYSTHIKVIAFL